MKPAPIFLLINGETDGPHEATEISDRLSGNALDEDDNPIEMLSEGTLSCIEGMPGWRSLPETLIWSYAKLLAALPQTADWIKQMDEHTLNLRDGNSVIRETLKRTANFGDFYAPDFIWKAFDANVSLLRRHRDYEKREQYWDLGAMKFYPVFELRFFNRKTPTRDWQSDWEKGGGKIYDGKMIARKDDPVWLALSDFGYPFEPFDFDHSAWVGSMSRQDAAKYGLIVDPATIKFPPLRPFCIIGL
jgi:hypothetical protein